MANVICMRVVMALCKQPDCEHVEAHEVEPGSPCLKSWLCKATYPHTWTYCIPVELNHVAGKDA